MGMRWWVVAAVGAALMAGCAAAVAPVRQFVKGDELAFYDFTQAGTFEEGTYSDGEARLQIRDGVYRMIVTEGDSVVWYGQWGEPHRDVVIDVEARQITESENTVYGVMCRARGSVGRPVDDPALAALAAEQAAAEATHEAEATAEATAEPTVEATAEATAEPAASLQPNNGDGYLFLVDGAGRFAIMRSRGRNVTPLVDWRPSDQIKRGAAQNQIRAVCLGDYLALYVNGQFMGDAIDDTYTQGQVGLAAAASGRLGITVEFDNLTVSAAAAR